VDVQIRSTCLGMGSAMQSNPRCALAP
jgi:hypothetical protein